MTKTLTKKPKWSVVTFKQIEARRVELGYSKSAIAEALGVTNSTLHNWKRGTTVPHPSQQEQIQATLATLAPAGDANADASKAKRAATPKTGAKSKASVKGKSGAKARANPPGTDTPAIGDVSGGIHATLAYAGSNPLYPSETPTVPGIATITAAFISSQPHALSAGSVYDFIRGLKNVFSEK